MSPQFSFVLIFDLVQIITIHFMYSCRHTDTHPSPKDENELCFCVSEGKEEGYLFRLHADSEGYYWSPQHLNSTDNGLAI